MLNTSILRGRSPALCAALVVSIGLLVAACGATTSPGIASQSAVPTHSPTHRTSGLATATASPGATQGILAGYVTSGSNCPAAHAEEPCPGQAAVGYLIAIKMTAGATVGVAKTDSNGHFMLVVAPGTYLVQPQGNPGTVSLRQNPSGPFTVVAGSVTSVQIILETGIAGA